MKCHKHLDLDAVGTCPDCGVGLCQACVKKFDFPICNDCNLKRLAGEKKDINNTFIRNTIIGILASLFFIGQQSQNNSDLLITLSLYFVFFVSYGWTFLSPTNTVNITINEGIIALLIRKMFKLVFSCIIGGFVGPYQIYKMKKRLKIVNETTQFIQSNA